MTEQAPAAQGTTCYWCGVNPRKEMPNGISPHSTWCPRYVPPPSAAEVRRKVEALMKQADADGELTNGSETR